MRCLSHDHVEPVASAAMAGIAALTQADGFIIITEGSEGFPAGALLPVHLHPEADRAPSYRETERKP